MLRMAATTLDVGGALATGLVVRELATGVSTGASITTGATVGDPPMAGAAVTRATVGDPSMTGASVLLLMEVAVGDSGVRGYRLQSSSSDSVVDVMPARPSHGLLPSPGTGGYGKTTVSRRPSERMR